MSFASDARGELARLSCADICCARAELAAALLSSGGISFRGKNRYALSLTSSDGGIARRYFGLLKQHWGITAELRTLYTETLNGQRRYQLVIPEAHSLALLRELLLTDDSALFGIRQSPDEALVKYACCKRAFLRAAFLMCGSVINPEKDYHMEIAAPTEDFAKYIIAIMNYYELSAKIACRKAKYVVYLKSAEDISEWLTLMGAMNAMMNMENIRVKKGVRNQINRQMNCDASNINRTMAAAEEQIRDIRYLDDVMALRKLTKPLRDVAEARLAYPDISLTDLGQMLEPPASKSAVNARLRKLARIAQQYREEEAPPAGDRFKGENENGQAQHSFYGDSHTDP